MGNPVTYYDGTKFTWTRGRMLDTLTTASGTTYTYKYDNQGFRKSKTVNGVSTQYVYNGDKLTYQTDGTTSLYFHYDGDNNITGFRYTKGSTDTEYYYVKNLQGDIIGILDGSGKVVVNYAYDAWGVCEVSGSLASTIGQINPIRYRGYYYDTESGLYYLMSRYYDAEVGRFINADDTLFLGINGTILSYNLFLYCENNFINMIDAIGFAAINVIFAAVGAVVGWPLGDFVAKKLGYYSGWKYWAIRAGVVVGSSVIGWFAGNLMAKIIATYLTKNPVVIFKITNKLGATGFYSAMKFLGINPFALNIDSSKFIAITRLFNTKSITISYDWALKLYSKAKALGFKISLDDPHSGFTWHIHISGANGKLVNLHVQVVKKAWDYLAKILR